MSEPFPCTTCGTMLRLPAGAAAGRCPNCKTVFTVPQNTPAPPPQAGPAPGAPPLPFGRTARKASVMPNAPLPSGPPSGGRGPTIRAKVAKEDPYELPEGADDETRAEADRKRKIREELRDMDRAKDREERKLDELTEHCEYGRIAVKILAAAIGLYGLGAAMQGLTLLGVGIKNNEVRQICSIAALACGLLTALVHMIGFGFAFVGPKIARHISYIAIAVCIMHLSLAAVLYTRPVQTDIDLNNHWQDCLPIQNRLGVATCLPMLADHPARFFNSYEHSYWGLGVATFEFTRFVLVCMMLQAYASGGKSPELGYRNMRAISRVFFLVLLIGSFRMAVSSGFDWISPTDTMFAIGLGAHGCLTTLFYVCFGLFSLLQIQTTLDVVDTVDVKRFVDKRSDLDR